MAITNATTLADYAAGISTQNATLKVDSGNKRVGIGTTNPKQTLQVGTAVSVYGNSGIVSATAFYGDGANLTNVGMDTGVLVSDQVLVLGVTTVGSAVTINSTGIDAVSGVITASSFVGGGANITALSGSNIASGTVAAARVATLNQNTTGTSAGLTGTPDIAVRNVTGVAATFTGVLTYEDVTNVDSVGIVTARSGIEFGAAGVGGTVTALGHAEFVGIVTASGLDAAISVWILGASGTNHYTFTGPGDLNTDADKTDPDLHLIRGQKYIFKNRSGGHPFRIQSTVNGSAGTAYNTGVTNNDAGDGTDLIFDVPFDAPPILYYQCTAHANMGGVIYIGSSSGDNVILSGICTVSQGIDLNGYKAEEGSYDTNALNGEFDFELENGHVQTHTGSTAGTYFPDFRVSSSQSLSSVMDVGDVVSATLIVAASNTAHYCTTGIKIDNSTSNVTIEWIGSSAPTAGKGAGYDIYAFTIQKTAATPAYLVIVNATDAG